MPEIGQFVVELLLQLFVELFADAVWRKFPEPARYLVKGALFITLSALFAWISTVFVPEPLIATKALQLTYLAVAPVLIGLAMAWIGRCFAKAQKARTALESFSFGWLFAFSFALTRFLLTS
jgi:hypothetical protein